MNTFFEVMEHVLLAAFACNMLFSLDKVYDAEE